ncbi:MAG: tetratricopeptide repeat protein [Phycisphaerales bacterium]
MRGVKDKVGSAGFAAVLMGLCLCQGCAPRQPVVNLYLDAVALRELGQDRLAVDKLNEVIEADPKFVQAYPELGKSYRKLGDQEKALAAFKQAVKLDAWSFEYQLDLARTYEDLKRHPQAAEAYGRAVELDPNSFDALTGAANCSVKAGQYAKALAYCEQAGENRSRELLPVLAQAYEGQKDYVRAVGVYERMWTPESPDPNVLVSLGVACVKAEKYERGREALLSATQMRPKDGAAFRHLGYCFIKLGDLDQAMQAYQQSIDLDGTDWEAYRGLGVACTLKADQTGDDRWREQGVRHWRRSLVINPAQPKREALEKLIRENARQESALQGLSY